ncbi:MAG: biotin--[acetyl-CoA-carboxylase] ligase [Acidimicrobiaceae bacterium]|nr:biotin--[acetyl-CoA-carboxylase] ligase [Acidimicrobiaceae bacterium]
MDQIIWRINHLAQVDSTNTWLAERARAGAPAGTVVYADFQTQGRGRLERSWTAPSGSSLLCSILLKPDDVADDPQLLVASVALAARGALVRLCGLRPDLKWPNDLMVGDAKIAGLLAELVGGDSPTVVVGIGVNLIAAGPAQARTTSVLQEVGVRVTSSALLDIMLEELDIRLVRMAGFGRDTVREEYVSALATIGQLVRVEHHHGVSRGRATGIDATGRLVVSVDGVDVAFASGDVVHLRLEESVIG